LDTPSYRKGRKQVREDHTVGNIMLLALMGEGYKQWKEWQENSEETFPSIVLSTTNFA
jgi:hypothetical protein